MVANYTNGSEEADLDVVSEIEDQEQPTSDEIPRELRTLRTQAYDKSVSDLVRMIREEDICFSPEYQRSYIWDNKKASLLIESILLNIPIPVVYASEEDDSTWNIVDGLQRLNALRRFYDNNFKLTGLEVLQELNGLRYDDLNDKAKRVLNNGMIRIILIFTDSHPEIKYDIFMRLNTGSVKLKEQELRNCLFRGKLNETLKLLRKNKKFLSILGLREPHKRMDDVELILRYFALSGNYDSTQKVILNYKGRIKTFLNNYMEVNKKMSEIKVQELAQKFNNTIDKVYLIFGDKAFRKIDKDGTIETSINRAIMDFILLSFEKYNSTELEGNKNEIISLLKELPVEDNIFDDAISIGTSETKKIEYRLSTWSERLGVIIGR